MLGIKIKSVIDLIMVEITINNNKGINKMNTEILVIWEQRNGLYTDKCFNFRNQTLSFYNKVATEKGFGGGLEVIKFKESK